MSDFPVVTNQRFFPVFLSELIDKDSYMVQRFVKNRSYMQIASDILIMVRYPMYQGQPDDEHKYSAYHGLFHYNRTIKNDYWDMGKEVLGTLVADCEGSSICFVSCMRAKDTSPKNVYEVLGYVTKENGEMLGGHGWSISKHLPDGNFRLYESTLDIPPFEYPIVPDIMKPVHHNGIVYVPEQIFNDKEYIEVWVAREVHGMTEETHTNYFMDRKDKKRRIRKHLEIAKAFNSHSRIEKAIGRSLLGIIRYGKMVRDSRCQDLKGVKKKWK